MGASRNFTYLTKAAVDILSVQYLWAVGIKPMGHRSYATLALSKTAAEALSIKPVEAGYKNQLVSYQVRHSIQNVGRSIDWV